MFGKTISQRGSEMLFYAFRYCLGRMTYAVSDFCSYATAHIGEIGRHELELMDKEITEADDADKADVTTTRYCSRLGWDCDRAYWLKLREIIRAELKQRDA